MGTQKQKIKTDASGRYDAIAKVTYVQNLNYNKYSKAELTLKRELVRK